MSQKTKETDTPPAEPPPDEPAPFPFVVDVGVVVVLQSGGPLMTVTIAPGEPLPELPPELADEVKLHELSYDPRRDASHALCSWYQRDGEIRHVGLPLEAVRQPTEIERDRAERF